MKKTLLSIAAITVSLSAAVAQNGITELPDADHNGLTITAMSPNAKFVAGSNASTFGGFIFDLENDKIVNFDVNPSSDDDVDVDLQIKAIANNGLAVGWNGPASTFDFSTQKCTTYGATDQYLFNGISPSGGYIVGARYDGTQTEGTPCIFHDGTPRDLPLPSNSFLGYESAGAAATSSTIWLHVLPLHGRCSTTALPSSPTPSLDPTSPPQPSLQSLTPCSAATRQRCRPTASGSSSTTRNTSATPDLSSPQLATTCKPTRSSSSRPTKRTSASPRSVPRSTASASLESWRERHTASRYRLPRCYTPRRLRRGLLQYALRHLCRRTLHSRLRIHLARRPGRGRILPLMGARHARPRRRWLRYSRRSYRRQRQRQGSKDKGALLARRRSTQHSL